MESMGIGHIEIRMLAIDESFSEYCIGFAFVGEI